MQFGVITKLRDIPGGNLAVGLDQIYQVTESPAAENNWLGKYQLVDPIVSLDLRVPVFALNEILVLDETGREIAGRGRKPDKWDVTCELFDSIEEAVERARQG